MQQIATALVKAQKAFAPALKTATNPHFRSKYVDLAGCIEAVIDALNANGIALVQRTHQDDTGVTVETLLIHESGETISGGLLHMPATKSDPQGFASALTYARRYSIMAACCIAGEDDDGNAASKPAPRPRPALVESRPAKTLEEIALLLTAAKTITELQVAWAGLTVEEKDIAKEIKEIRKQELTK